MFFNFQLYISWMSEDTLLEIIEILEYALEEKKWNSVEEALSLLKEENENFDPDNQ